MDSLELLLPVLLYAETHYSFKGIYSRLKKNEPEIIADAPYRIEPGNAIPVLILLKDCDKFPISIENVDIHILKDDKIISQKTFRLQTGLISNRFHSILLEMKRPENLGGLVKVDVIMEVRINDKPEKYKNDNYRISSHAPLEVYLAQAPLPKTGDWFYGDMHCHTSYTEDQAEFGAPLEASLVLSRALGLSFFAVTDHSYDLDDEVDNYLKNDPNLKKWELYKQEIADINDKYPGFVLLPGEEVSAGNSKNRNVHMLVIHNEKFIPGKGDGAENWFHTTPDLNISEIFNAIDDNAITIAAHSEMPVPFLQWLLIRRGRWHWKDYCHDRLNGIQVWNGITDSSLFKGLQRWVDLLLNGKKLYVFAGNDAHGNFNRFRQIGFPFWTFREKREQIFGEMKTAVKVDEPLSVNSLLKTIKQGRCIITNGPFVEFIIRNEHGETAHIGDYITGDRLLVFIHALTTVEFGTFDHIKVYYGIINDKQEQLIHHITTFNDDYAYSVKMPLDKFSGKPAYIRLECITSNDDKKYRCYTNPVWIG